VIAMAGHTVVVIHMPAKLFLGGILRQGGDGQRVIGGCGNVGW